MATAVDYGRMYTPDKMYTGYVNTDTRVGDEVVTQGLAQDLEAFYNKSDSSGDKAKALELLSSLRLGGERQQEPYPRPHTAMPTVGGQYHSNPYVTSYTRDYPMKEQPFTGATRPMTSHGFRNGPIGDTTYAEEYKDKPNRPASPIRSGSASGQRNNNPHPLQAFMVWRFPTKTMAEPKPSPWSEELTDDKINQVHKRLCQSTYQTDYLGIPQGFQLKSAYTLPPDWKADIPYTLDSVARYSYQNPTQPEQLKLPISRYGSNKKKSLAVNGTSKYTLSRYGSNKKKSLAVNGNKKKFKYTWSRYGSNKKKSIAVNGTSKYTLSRYGSNKKKSIAVNGTSKYTLSRYGSNKKKSIAVNGTIPTASLRYNHIKQRTTYDKHYNDNSGAVVQQIKDVGRKLGAETLKKYYEKAAPEDKDTIKRILDAYRTGDMPPSKPVHAPTPPPYRPASRTPSRSNQPSTPISESDNSVPINISNRVSGPNSPAMTPNPMRKPGSRVACTPITDYNSGNPTNYSRPQQFQFPMQVPMPNYSPAPAPYSPPQFLH
ncbi:unnamed protein product [Mytilus coruscus]|uniref:Uncharacterized protein n=1 Tax=Mytilus coruscus TaxID=42192 RepID=A0A6J8A4P0_MYTCO|nr:unnamed protein product [Mytilus coruscus]